MHIEQGQLYKVVTDNFVTTGKNNKIKRKVFLGKGEIIEIRYPYPWHFRTEDDNYFHAEPEMIEQNCELLGTIYEPVFFANKAKLAEIVSIQLYSKPKR